jgi:hypothetical protein
LLQTRRRFHCLAAARQGSHALAGAAELRTISPNTAGRLSHSPPDVLHGACRRLER